MSDYEKLEEIARRSDIAIESPRQLVLNHANAGPVNTIPDGPWTASVTFYLFRERNFVKITAEFSERSFSALVDSIYREYMRQK